MIRTARGLSVMSPMTKVILLALLTLMTTAEASAQSRTVYDNAGRVVARSSTDSSGTVTTHDARGRVISRELTSGNVTTIYDLRGWNVGRFTTSR